MDLMPYILGGLGGGGALCVWYGLKRLRDDDRPEGTRRKGLRLVNLGVVLIAATLAIMIWGD